MWSPGSFYPEHHNVVEDTIFRRNLFLLHKPYLFGMASYPIDKYVFFFVLLFPFVGACPNSYLPLRVIKLYKKISFLIISPFLFSRKSTAALPLSM